MKSGLYIKKIKNNLKIFIPILGIILSSGVMSLATASASADHDDMGSSLTPAVVYNALPSVSPQTNYPSQPFQAQQTYEFGDSVHLGGTARTLNSVTVTMSDWAEYSTYQNNPTYSGNSTYWSYPITLNVYSTHLNSSGAPDQLLATTTQNINVPWRPAGNPSCPDAGYGAGFAWKDGSGNCLNGLAFNATFDLSSSHVTLPDDIIVSVAFNTQSYGTNPTGVDGPYNSLNVAVPANQAVSVGSDTSADSVFWNTHYCSWYTDAASKSQCGSGNFGLYEDTGWTPYGTVAFQVTATPALTTPPTTLSQCYDNGWKTFNNPSYRNQGQCISYVWRHSHNISGYVAYTAYGLKRTANFWMNTAMNRGFFHYRDANRSWYDVSVSDVNVSGNSGYFAGVVTRASNKAWVGQWLFAKVENAHPSLIWGSFTNETAAQAGVANMTNPADGPFTVTRGHIEVR